MPIYGYECQSCGHEMEALQKISDAPLTDCPACGEPQLKKQLSAASFRLSGTGWYETDFKKDKRKNLAGDREGSSGSSASESSPKSGEKKGDGDKGVSGSDKASSQSKSSAKAQDSGSKPSAKSSSSGSSGDKK